MKKRILYLNSTSPNYLADLTLDGLYGADFDIVEIPPSDKQNIKRNRPMPFVTLSEVIKLCNGGAFHACIISNVICGEAASLYVKLMNTLVKNNITIIALDDSDQISPACHTTFNINQMLNINYVLKREVSSDFIYNLKTIKYLYSSDVRSISDLDSIDYPENDLMFYGSVATQDRISLMIQIEQYKKLNNVVSNIRTNNFYDALSQYTIQSEVWKSYIKQCSNSKICFCPPGQGIDTLRFWEIAPLKNPFIFIPKKTASYYDFQDFNMDGIVVYKDDLTDLKFLISEYLNNYNEKRNEIINRVKYISENHSNITRISSLIDSIIK